jgi:1-carboxybiuret hydrolase subunit AtzG-like
MNEPFDAATHVDRMAMVMGLKIAPEWRASVVYNMAATAQIAERVLSLPLDDHVEPAPVFEA